MRCLITILLIAFSTHASAADVVKTRAGELKIAGDLNAPKLLLNSKVLASGTESLTYSFQDWAPYKFTVKDADVILVSDSVSAMCTTWFFVTIPSPPAAATKTKKFGMICGEGGPEVTQKGDVLTIKVPDGEKTKTFKYVNGQIK